MIFADSSVQSPITDMTSLGIKFQSFATLDSECKMKKMCFRAENTGL